MPMNARDLEPPRRSALRRPRALAWAVVLGAVVLTEGCVSAPGSTRATPAASVTSAAAAAPTTTPPTSTTSTLPDRLPASVDPNDLALTASLERTDISGGAVKFEDGHDMPRSEDACMAISHSPFLANLRSPTFSDGLSTDFWFASQVAVEPTTRDATTVVDRMRAQDWVKQCDLSANTAELQHVLDQVNAEGSCNFAITGKSELPIDDSTLPPGVTGWRYRASIHCGVTGADSVTYVDDLLAQVGPVVILLYITTTNDPPTDIDQHVIAVLADRAKAALAP